MEALLFPQDSGWIEHEPVTGREQAREQADAAHDRDDEGQDLRIAGADVEEQARQPRAEGERAGDAGHESDGDRRETLPHYQADRVGAIGTERDPDVHLATAPRDAVGCHRVHAERRDRSILFWKSMPVSDLHTVLAKAAIPVLVLPLVTFVVTMGTQAMMLLMGSVMLAASGLGAGTVWSQLSLIDLTRINFVHLVTFHGILWAPLYGWLLLVSAWAARAPFLWAVLPPVAIGIAERIAFDTTYVATLVRDYLIGGGGGGPGSMTMDMLTPHSLGEFLARPGLWVGLAAAAAMLAGAVRLRRARGPL